MKKIKLVVFFFTVAFCSKAQSCLYNNIDSNYTVKFVCKGGIQLNGKIDDTSSVQIKSIDSNIVITGRIDRNSKVILEARNGNVSIGDKIDAGSNIQIICKGDILIQGKIDGDAIGDFAERYTYDPNGNILTLNRVALAAMVDNCQWTALLTNTHMPKPPVDLVNTHPARHLPRI